MRGLSWLKHEIKLQFKNGLYMLYVFVTCIYVLLISYVPELYKDLALTFIIFSDPTFLGMVFVGSIFLLEKEQGIPKAIGISPLGVRNYILGKVISLILISLLASASMVIVVKGIGVQWTFLILGISLGASLFTMIGIVVASYMKNTNPFLITISLLSSVFILPLIYFYGVWDISIFNFLPSYSVIVLIKSGIENTVNPLWLGHSLYLVLWQGILYAITRKSIENKVFVG